MRMNFGIAGSGMIVPEFILGTTYVDEIHVAAICGRAQSEEKVRRMACEHDIKKVYFHYDEMLADEEIDAVYVALTNNLHHQYAKEALLAGKHVLLEKPFCAWADEAAELVAIAKEKKLILMEAITNQYYPNYYKMKELLPQIGDVRIATMNYSQYSSRYDKFKQGIIAPVFDPAMAGGALRDLNVYNVYLAVGLFGKPLSVQYYPNVVRGIDTSGILILQYENMQCVCVGAKDCACPVNMSIQGDKGYIRLDEPSNVFENVMFRLNGQKEQIYHLNEIEGRMQYELAEFVRLVDEKDYDTRDAYLEKTMIVMEILDAALRNI